MPDLTSIYSISDISAQGLGGLQGTSMLTITPPDTTMKGYKFRCILMSGIEDVENTVSGSFNISVLPTDFKTFDIAFTSSSMGHSVYDNSILLLGYDNGAGGVGKREIIVDDDLRNSFVNSDKEPYYNLIDLSKFTLSDSTQKEMHDTLLAISLGTSVQDLADNKKGVSIEKKATDDFDFGSESSKTFILEGKFGITAADVTNGIGSNGNGDKSILYRKVFESVSNLESYTETANSPIKIKPGNHTYIGYLRPFTKEKDASNIENYVFSSNSINGQDNDAPEILFNPKNDIKWESSSVSGAHSGTYTHGQYSNSQGLIVETKITDNNLETKDLVINWYKGDYTVPGANISSAETVDSTLLSNNNQTLSLTGTPDELEALGGCYTIIATDPKDKTGSGKNSIAVLVDIGNPWDKTAPTLPEVDDTVISDLGKTTTYKKLSVVGTVDNVNGSGLANKAFIISTNGSFKLKDNESLIPTDSNFPERLTLDEDNPNFNWSSINSDTYDQACTVYVYARDNAGNISYKEYSIEDIDHEAPTVTDLSTKTIYLPCKDLIEECGHSDAQRTGVAVMLTAEAVDNEGGTPENEILYKFQYVTDEEYEKPSAERNIETIRAYKNEKSIEAEKSGWYRVWVKDKANNESRSTFIYLDINFLTGKVGDIFDEFGTGYKDLAGGFIDHKGGCKDELGGFNDTKGGGRDGFYDHDGGFTDKGAYIDNKTFVDECGYINTDGYDFNAFVDVEGFVDLSGYVDVKSCKDLKGKPGKDYRCDLCGLSRIKCLCKNATGDRGYIDNKTGDGCCDDNPTVKVKDCTTHNSPDGKCDRCGQNYNNCSCESDSLCDKCYKVHDNCTHTGQNSYDGLCDVCFNNRDKCTCRGTGTSGPDGYCDVCHNLMGNDGKCPECKRNDISADECDICGQDYRTHLNLNDGDPCAAKDGLCDTCSYSRSKCTCKNSSGVIGPDGLCDVCGKLIADCICGNGLCDRCTKPYYECTCGDGICDVCGNDKQNCTCGNKDGRCDVCQKALTSCTCGDGFCDNEGCGKPEKDCVCKDHLCDKCGHTFDEDEDSEHKGFCTDTDCRDCKDLLCDNDLCDKCGRNRLACECDTFTSSHICGLPEKCQKADCTAEKDEEGRCYQYDYDENGNKVYHHCICGDGRCDICGKTKDQTCTHVGGTVSFRIANTNWTKENVILMVTSTGNILAADKPFSWWDPKTKTWGVWTNSNTMEATENGEYNVRVKTSTGFVKEAHPIIVTNIDRTAPIVQRPEITDGTKEIKVTVQDPESSGEKKVGCSGISKICYIYTDEKGYSDGIEHQFSVLPDTDSENEAITCRSMMDKFGTYQLVAYDNAGNKGYAQYPVVLTKEGVKTDSPFLQDEPSPSQMKERFITIEPETWTNDFVTIRVNFESNEGLASNPYEWNGQATNSPTYKVYDNETVKLTILDSYFHAFPVEDIVITNIDKLAPEFTIDYDKNNGNKVKIKAEDKGVGLAAIFWKSTTSPTLTKVMDIPESKSIGVNEFELDIPKMDIYKIYVSDKLGNISKEDSSHEFSASYAIDNTSSGSNGGNSSNGSSSSSGNSSSSIEEMLKLLGALNGSNSGNANNGYTQGSSLSDSTIQKLLSSLGSNSNSSGTNPPYNYGNYYPSGATSSKTTSDSSTSKAQNLTNPYGNSSPVINVNTAEEKEEDEEEVKRAQVKEDENTEESEEANGNNELSPDDYQESSIDLDEFSFDTGADNDTPLSEEENNSDEPKKSSKALWAILIALGTIALGGGAFYIYKQKKFSNDLIEDDDDLFGTGEEDTQDISEISEEDINKDFEDDIEEDIE